MLFQARDKYQSIYASVYWEYHLKHTPGQYWRLEVEWMQQLYHWLPWASNQLASRIKPWIKFAKPLGRVFKIDTTFAEEYRMDKERAELSWQKYDWKGDQRLCPEPNWRVAWTNRPAYQELLGFGQRTRHWESLLQNFLRALAFHRWYIPRNGASW